MNNLEQLRKALEAWLSTRMDGDFTKIPGQSVKADKKDKPVSSSSYFRGDGKPSCGVCGKIGHRVRCVGIRKRSPAAIAVVVQPAQGTSQNP